MPSAQTFQSQFKVKFRDADPAGLMYFANLFSVAHDVFEEFVQELGIPFGDWFSGHKYLIPIRHTEADYLAGFVPGETYQVRAYVGSLSNSTFVMHYEFSQSQGPKEARTHATLKMAHTFIDAKSKNKIAVPEAFRSKLENYLHAEPA